MFWSNSLIAIEFLNNHDGKFKDQGNLDYHTQIKNWFISNIFETINNEHEYSFHVYSTNCFKITC